METLIPFVAMAIVIQKIVERLRVDLLGHFLNGWKVSLLSIGLGLVVAWSSGMEMFAAASASELPGFSFDLVWWMDRVLTGISLGLGAGFIADLTGRSNADGEKMVVPAVFITPDIKPVDGS